LIIFRWYASLLGLAGFALFAQGVAQPSGAASASEHTSQSQDVGHPLAVGRSTAARWVFGFRDFAEQARWDAEFLEVPDAELARQHMKTLTAAPHWASSPEDYATALYVADRFKAAGLETEIVPYSVLMNKPVSLLVEAFDAAGKKIFSGPTREHVGPDTKVGAGSAGDRFQDDPRVLPGFNGSSPSGDVTAEVVYANYGRLADFRRLVELGVSVKGKIVLVRYGGDFRGVKVYLAEQYGAKGVLIYSDPADDGFVSGATYPEGPYRPDSAVQRGSVQFMPIYPGDPTTPGIASVPGLPEAKRIPLDKLQYDQPTIPVNPLSSADAAPILRALGGPVAAHDWQGGLAFAYHVGGGAAPVSVHLRLVQDTRLRTIWDVMGRIPGTADGRQWVIAGNHRDAWVYGAADPGSGTAAMLEAVHGLGALLRQGWRPRRTIVVASWDAEEEGLMGSTEWAEQHAAELGRAAAYFNMDVAVSGPTFQAAAVPSLREFVREIAKQVPSPAGGTVFERWKKDEEEGAGRRAPPAILNGANLNPGIATQARVEADAHVGDLGSGSDYTPFLQHLGVPSTDIGSDGPFGVYHTVYDNYDWFVRFADPSFAYTQQQARVFGLEMLHMADADVLPYDYREYGEEIRGYLEQASSRAAGIKLDFAAALGAAERFAAAGAAMRARQLEAGKDAAGLDRALAAAERALLIPEGLPRRPWYRHSIYAPGEFTGYAAVVIPGVNEGIEAADATRTQAQLGVLAQALNRAAAALDVAGR
jgi:N-acetylated-alpha-linked acidic dipeptidase